jgi:hypothetical protein
MAEMSEIEQIKHTGKFVWGEPTQWHKIGPYTILEFHPWKTKGHTIITGEPDTREKEFHGWIDGKDNHESWPTLETAIIGLIATKYTGINNAGLGYRVCRMFEAPPYDKHMKSTIERNSNNE